MKHLLSMFLLVVAVFQTASLSTLIHPIMAEEKKPNKLQVASIKLKMGDPGEKILSAISMTSKQTSLSQELLLSLMYSESSFKSAAVSGKQYQGLMQIPKSNLHQHRSEDVNTLIGARILLEKLEVANGDLKKAIILYKGWGVNDPEGRRQADKVLVLAQRLKEV